MYQSKLTIKETQKAIKIVKDDFEDRLAKALNLDRVSAPIMVISNEGINDDLGIKNSALSFKLDTFPKKIEIIQSLAKWKRMALQKYGYDINEGLYTDMNAIRQKEILDNLHSYYVDQWDWELIINKDDRNLDYLKQIVTKIVLALKETKEKITQVYPNLTENITSDVFFISALDLFKMYPNLTPKEREKAITKIYKTVFIIGIGYPFINNEIHDLRAPDYDDWHLNGDLLIWSDTIGNAIEISSMGIRVDEKSLLEQLKFTNRLKDINGSYYQMLLNNQLPQTIGGGIGQSRICMVLLEKYHIAEVQASIWNDDTYRFFKENKIEYL